MENAGTASMLTKILPTVIALVAAIIVLYGLYSYLQNNTGLSSTDINTQIVPGNSKVTPGEVPTMQDGSPYTISTWIQVTSWKTNLGKRKHILEIGGDNFSTIFLGLGAFQNSVVVRLHTRSTVTETGVASPKPPTSNPIPRPIGNSSGDICGNLPTVEGFFQGSSTPAAIASSGGSLFKGDIEKLMKPMSMDTTSSEGTPICDLPEIDLQRWVHIVVVLSGRTVDVQMDGKLTRSCALPSTQKVDPIHPKAKLLEYGGFDGDLGSTRVMNYELTPDQIYRLYLNGPRSSTQDFWGWLGSLFSGNN